METTADRAFDRKEMDPPGAKVGTYDPFHLSDELYHPKQPDIVENRCLNARRGLTMAGTTSLDVSVCGGSSLHLLNV